MSVKLDFKKLKSAVKKIQSNKKEREKRFKECVGTKGEIYLYENVIRPFLEDKVPDAAILDLSAFTMNDLESVAGYYCEYIGEESENYRAVKPFYEVFLAEKPQASTVAFL